MSYLLEKNGKDAQLLSKQDPLTAQVKDRGIEDMVMSKPSRNDWLINEQKI